MAPLRIAIIGYGKIARDEHVPAIETEPRFALAATVSRQGLGAGGVPCFKSHEALLAADLALDAVALCTPPAARYDIARACLYAGLHTLLEKPPAVSLGEVEELARLAEVRGKSLFTTWHAQHNPAVAAAAELLAGRRLRELRIVWREDVRKWHPGQQWIWAPGGFGVFDPGINALSIATHVVPGPLFVREAELVFPSNRQAPITATLKLASPAADGPLVAEFDWRHSGGEAWTIEIATADGDALLIADGGARLERNGSSLVAAAKDEYGLIYRRFAELIEGGASQVDLAPLRLTAEAFLVGARHSGDPFDD
jgi:D-galactose 1-dehydrogenase